MLACWANALPHVPHLYGLMPARGFPVGGEREREGEGTMKDRNLTSEHTSRHKI